MVGLLTKQAPGIRLATACHIFQRMSEIIGRKRIYSPKLLGINFLYLYTHKQPELDCSSPVHAVTLLLID